MKNKLKTILLLIAAIIFAYSTVLLQPSTKDAIPTVTDNRTAIELPILMYHGLTENPSNITEYTILASTFENDLKWLKDNGFTTISAKQLVDYVEKGKALPEKPVMITFDDGYKNNYTLAFPILKNHNMKAIVSIIGSESDFATETNDKSTPNLTWNQIKAMYDSGLIEIGSHTYDLHKNSPERKGADKAPGESTEHYRETLAADLEKSSKRIEEVIGTKPIVFAWPFGAYPLDGSAEEVLENLGFKAALTSYQIKNDIVQGDTDSLLKLK